MSGTQQQMNKRPKLVARPENVDYFKERCEYKRHSTVNDALCYRYYNQVEIVGGRTMEEWIRPALSFRHFRKYGYDWSQNSKETLWTDGIKAFENCKRAIKCSFELCSKLGLKYWSAYDSDLVPWCRSHEEDRQRWTEVADFLYDNIQRNSIKVIRIGVDLRSNPRYTPGVTRSAQSYFLAASQIKRTLDLAHKVDSEAFLIRPPCQDLFANVEEDMKRFANLLLMTAQYKYQIGYRGQLLITGDVEWFMWDGVSCFTFLRRYSLEKNFKIVVGPGTDMIMCNFYKTLGGLDLKDMLHDNTSFTTAMKHIINQGSTMVGGTSLTMRPPRRHLSLCDLQQHYAQQVDSLARALRVADRINGDQTLRRRHEFQEGSPGHGFSELGVSSSDLTLEQCDQLVKKCQQTPCDTSQERTWQYVLQQYWDNPYQD